MLLTFTPTKVINRALKNQKPRDLSSWQRNATGSDIQGSFWRQLQPVFATGDLSAFACKPHRHRTKLLGTKPRSFIAKASILSEGFSFPLHYKKKENNAQYLMPFLLLCYFLYPSLIKTAFAFFFLSNVPRFKVQILISLTRLSWPSWSSSGAGCSRHKSAGCFTA